MTPDPIGETRRGPLLPRSIARIAPGLEALLHYDAAWLRSDIAAGLSVAAVALPVGIAYAEITRVPAVVGIYSAIFPLFAYALFGSSRKLIVGPDSATCVLIAASLLPLAAGDPQRYLALMVVLTLITGVFLVVGGVLRLGFIASFLSQPILTGFLNGIALVIIVGQLKTLCGYSSDANGFFLRLVEFVHEVEHSHRPTLILGLGLLAVFIAVRRVYPRLPSMLVVMVVSVLVVAALGLDQKGVAVLGTVPAGLPAPSVVLPTWPEFKTLLSDGGAIALLVFISGILTVKSFARQSRQDVDSTQELIGFGASNIVSGLLQGFPVTGATSRTAVNVSVGGKSQLAGILAALAMLLVLFFFTAPLGHIPKTALAAVIIVSGLSLFDNAALRELYATSRLEFGVCMVAMFGVLLLGVLPGVGLAVGLSLGWLLYVESRPSDAILGRVPGMKGYHNVQEFPEATTVPGLLVYQFNAPLVFYNADYFKRRAREVVANAQTPVQWLVLDASAINYMDVTALQTVYELVEELATRGVRTVVVNLKSHVMRPFRREWVRERLGRHAGDIFPTIKVAIKAFEQAKRQPAGADSGTMDS